MLCESQEFGPGQRGVIVTSMPRGMHLRGVYMDPPTAAAFTIEGVDELSPGEMLVLGLPCAAGVRLAVRNDAAAPARFRATLDCAPDEARMERELARIVERDWAAAYDRARRERNGGRY